MDNQNKEEFKKLMIDELILGESYCEVDSNGIKRLDPLDPKTQGLFTEKLTLDELIERYPLTEEQITNLKKLMNNGK